VAISLSTAACRKENQKPDYVRTVGEIQSPSQVVLPQEPEIMGKIKPLPVEELEVCPNPQPEDPPAPSKE
jgi:hypothetical protein